MAVLENLDLYAFERQVYQENTYNLFCGVDEAGRGPLAGPVFAAAVILPKDTEIAGLNDSKKLSEKKREALFHEIIRSAVCYQICQVDEKTIDRLNILGATMFAMKTAVEGLQIRPDAVFVDGSQTPQLDIPAFPVVKGDAKSASIAAASILAKVARDQFMCQLSLQYPQYLFCKHKGYPTKLHYEKIAEHGISPVHRKSFLKTLHKHIKK